MRTNVEEFMATRQQSALCSLCRRAQRDAEERRHKHRTALSPHQPTSHSVFYARLGWGRFSLSTLVLSFCSRTGGPAPHCHHLKRKLTNSIVSAAPPCLVSGSVCTRHTPATPFGFLPRNVSVPWVVRILRQRGFGRGHMW